MQHILGHMRRAIEDYQMIAPGDHIGVGLSGGKDSVTLLMGLAGLRRVLPYPFSLTAFTLDPCFNNQLTDYSAMEALCRELEVPYIIERTNIGPVVFDERKEKNPCSLCARMRRGALHNLCNAHGCKKLALGHHMDDAVETFFLNLYNEGRIGCFSPVTYLSRKDIHLIRPMVFLEEGQIRGFVESRGLSIVKSLCPYEGEGHRTRIKAYIGSMCQGDRGFKRRIFGAMKRDGLDGW
jgi:tRNA 2-thiocytidine biosynthesis protein TtcA